MLVGWVWIPISLIIGTVFGVVLSALCIANGGDD